MTSPPIELRMLSNQALNVIRLANELDQNCSYLRTHEATDPDFRRIFLSNISARLEAIEKDLLIMSSLFKEVSEKLDKVK